MDRIFNKLSLAFGILALMLEQQIVGIFTGFAFAGGHLCDYRYGGDFLISHSDPYMHVHNAQLFVVWPILFFLLLKLLERGVITRLAALILIVIAAVNWFVVDSMISQDMADLDKYIDPMRETVTERRLIFGFVLTAAVMHVAGLIVHLRKPKKADLQ